jgi:hypothetical protein
MRVRRGRPTDPGLRGLGRHASGPNSGPLAAGRTPVAGPGHDAGMVARGLRPVAGAPRPGHVPRTGSIHASDQPGPGPAGRPRARPLDRAAAVLGRAGRGDRIRSRGVGLVDLLGTGIRLPGRPERGHDRGAIRGGGAGLGAGALGRRRLAAGPARRVGAGRRSRPRAGPAALRRAVLVGLEGPPARIQPGPAAAGRAPGCGPGRRPAPQRTGGCGPKHGVPQPGDHTATAQLPDRVGDAAAWPDQRDR